MLPSQGLRSLEIVAAIPQGGSSILFHSSERCSFACAALSHGPPHPFDSSKSKSALLNAVRMEPTIALTAERM